MILGVMVGGALGALARYLTTLFMQQALQPSALASLPVATFCVNLIGSFLLSFLLYSNYFEISPVLRTAIGTGFIGSLTTFSTFELESQQLFVKGQWLMALSYLLSSVALGFLAILLGKVLANQLNA